jgi:hypothetical protein
MTARTDSKYGNATGALTCTATGLVVGSGDKVVVLTTWRDDSGETISGVTHNGSATGFASHYTTTVADDMQVACWVGTGVSAATGDIVVTWSGAPVDAHVHAYALSSAGTVGTPTPVSSGAVDTSVSASLSSNASDLLIGAHHQRATGISGAATAPATLRHSGESGFGSTGLSATRAGTGGSTSLQFTFTNASFALGRMILVNVATSGASPATLSSATPSGTIGTSTSAAIGATTDTSSGTFYAVVDTAGNISGITAAQIKAGQNNGSVSALSSNSVAVSTTSPQTTCTGLSAATAYSYAIVQNSAGGDSNVLTGTFTTAAAAANPQNRVFGPQGAIKTLLTM